MSASPIQPDNSSIGRTLKLVVSAIYVLVPLALLVYRMWAGQSVDSLVLLIVVVLMFASAYTIYGEKTVDKATEKAEQMAGDEE